MDAASEFSLVLPCFNEAGNIRRTVEESFRWFREEGIAGEIIVVDDGSTDSSADILSSLQRIHPRLVVVRHQSNRGYGAAVRSGIDAAQGALVAFMDSDGQFQARDFSLLLPYMDRADLVTGRRMRRADSLVRKMNARLFGGLVYLMFGVLVRDVNCAMKLFRRDIWSRIRPVYATGALFNAELFLALREEGCSFVQVPVSHFPRGVGVQTGAKFRVIVRMVCELLRLRRAQKRGVWQVQRFCAAERLALRRHITMRPREALEDAGRRAGFSADSAHSAVPTAERALVSGMPHR